MVHIYNVTNNYGKKHQSGSFLSQMFEGMAQGMSYNMGIGSYNCGYGGYNTCGYGPNLFSYGGYGCPSVESACGEVFGGTVAMVAGQGLESLLNKRQEKSQTVSSLKTSTDTAEAKVKKLKEEKDDLSKKTETDYETEAKKDSGVTKAYDDYIAAEKELNVLKAKDQSSLTVADKARIKELEDKSNPNSVDKLKEAYNNKLKQKETELKDAAEKAKDKEISDAEKELNELKSKLATEQASEYSGSMPKKEYEKIKSQEAKNIQDQYTQGEIINAAKKSMYYFAKAKDGTKEQKERAEEFCKLYDAVDPGNKSQVPGGDVMYNKAKLFLKEQQKAE